MSRIALMVVATIVLFVLSGCSGAPASQSPASEPAKSQPASSSSSASKPDSNPQPSSSGGSASQSPAGDSAGIPSGATDYDPKKIYKVGDAVKLPVSGVVLQVKGFRTVEKDAESEWLISDVVIGNTGAEPASVSALISFKAVSTDWHWYDTGDVSDLVDAMAKETVPEDLLDTDVPPGEARSGAVLQQVPKSAKGVALWFRDMDADRTLSGETDPSIFVDLGIRGEWSPPSIPDTAATAQAGETFKIGEAIKFPKRGVALVVNDAYIFTKQATAPGSTTKPLAPSRPEFKYFVLDITKQNSGDAKRDLSLLGEMLLVGADGEEDQRNIGSMNAGIDSMKVLWEENGTNLGVSQNGEVVRGMLVVEVHEEAKGVFLKISPNDDTRQPIEDEVVMINLGR